MRRNLFKIAHMRKNPACCSGLLNGALDSTRVVARERGDSSAKERPQNDKAVEGVSETETLRATPLRRTYQVISTLRHPSKPQPTLTTIWLLLLHRWLSGARTSMAEILLGILAKQLAFVATDRALDNRFGPRDCGDIQINRGHTLRLPLAAPVAT